MFKNARLASAQVPFKRMQRRLEMIWPAIPKPFWTRPKSEFGEHLATQVSYSVLKNNDCMDDFWPLSCYVRFQCQQSSHFSSTYATNRHR